jgi:GNAT superfamily N-acetyltransferase
MPRTNMEALAIGKPIVTTDVPGCAETVEDGINGFLVPSADAKALEAALDRLLSNPSLREAMGRASLEKARRDFSIQQMVSRLQQAHQDAWLEHTQACREHHPAGSTPMRAQHPPRSLKEGCTTAKPGELQIQPLDASSLGRVVEIHRQAFPAFFLTALGPGFLRCLYEEISHDAKGIALCCTHSGEIVGFVAGTSQPSGFYRRLLWRRWWRFAFAGLGTVLKRPHYVPRILNAFHKPAEALRAEAQRGECYAELMSIGVCPEAQGTGVGKFLVNAFLSECWRRGLDRVSLTTDSMGNDSANQFYLRNGFALTRTFSTAQGRVMNEYEIWVTRRDGVIRREASIVL